MNTVEYSSTYAEVFTLSWRRSKAEGVTWAAWRCCHGHMFMLPWQQVHQTGHKSATFSQFPVVPFLQVPFHHAISVHTILTCALFFFSFLPSAMFSALIITTLQVYQYTYSHNLVMRSDNHVSSTQLHHVSQQKRKCLWTQAHNYVCKHAHCVQINISGGQPALSQGTIRTRFLTLSHFLQLYSLPPSPCQSSNPSPYQGRQSLGSSVLRLSTCPQGKAFSKGCDKTTTESLTTSAWEWKSETSYTHHDDDATYQ